MNNDYSYDKNLISVLGYDKLVEKYKLDNVKLNESVFFASTALASHLKKITSPAVDNTAILLGDYYSFEYYDKLKDDLEKLVLLTNAMERNYIYLALQNNKVEYLIEFILNIPTVLLEFYNIKLTQEDKESLVVNFYEEHKEQLKYIFSEEVELNKLLLELKKC